ncbi:MAG: zinc ribbon domain-containing protein [Elusimicrobia bacterium]|nr:zinc ribbon domain-containing protein [Elusimicrobiota bacterium]
MKCPKCSARVEPDSVFCYQCGAEIPPLPAKGKGGASDKNLIRCPDCGKSVSSSAPTCPGCGRRMEFADIQEKQARRVKRGNVQGMGCLVILISLGLMLLSPLLGTAALVMGILILIMGLVM